MSKAWNIVETKAKLSEVLKRANLEPQVIESRGEPIAVIISIDEYTRLNEIAGNKNKKPSIKEFLQLSKILSKKLKENKIVLDLPDRKDRKLPKLGE